MGQLKNKGDNTPPRLSSPGGDMRRVGGTFRQSASPGTHHDQKSGHILGTQLSQTENVHDQPIAPVAVREFFFVQYYMVALN